MVGEQLGPYTIEATLGVGGMGTVYRATGPEGMVAIKVVHPHLLAVPGTFQRFLREAAIGKQLEHPNLVRTFHCDQLVLDGTPHAYLVMEYVQGQTLRGLLDELQRVPEELCRHIGREAALGLEAIHAAGAIHRDLKPENVLITEDHAVKVMDLGVAHLVEQTMLSQTGGFVGSVLYAAPEQFRGEQPDRRADYYSLGLILYELATGHHPSRADDIATVMERRLHEVPRGAAEINPQLSPFFEEVLRALLARNPARRPGRLATVLRDGENGTWWRHRHQAIRAATKQPLRRMRIPRETAVYGRERELETLRRCYGEVRAGDGRVVLIEGEAGIGKSRLVDEFIATLRGDGEDLNFLFASNPPGGAATPAGACSTAFREHFGPDELDDLLPDYMRTTPVLIPAFAALLRGESTPAGCEPLTKDSLQTVFVHVTRALAAERPTVIAIEDLHFAPQEARALLAALALAVPDHRVLLLATTRPELSRDWISNLDRFEHVHHLQLERLGPKDLGKLLIDAFQSERLARELALKIATKSDGNPFFVFEIVRGLREGKFITRLPDGTWDSTRAIDEIAIPPSVRELIQARIADLDESERELLDVAACCGFEFDPLLVGAVLDVPDIPLLRRLGRLEHPHRLVRSMGLRYVFDHHQVQEVLYETQSELLRCRYHAAIGDAMERRSGANAGEPGALAVDLCSHFLAGEVADRALRYLDAALAHLGRCYLNEQAVALADRALAREGLLAGTQRAEVLLNKAACLDLLGRGAAQETALEEAAALASDAKLRARVHRAVAWCHLRQSRFESAESECRRAVALCREAGDRHGEALAVGTLGSIFWSLGRYEEARDHFERQLEISRELGDRQSVAKGIGNLGLVHYGHGRYEQARQHAERHLAISREIGYRLGEANATGNLGIIFRSLGRREEARAHFEGQLALTREIGDRRGEATALGNLGILLRDLGRYEKADECYERQLAIARETGNRMSEAISAVNQGTGLAWSGALAAARARLDEALAICREIGAQQPEGYALHSLAFVDYASGDLAQAERQAEKALALRREINYRAGIAESLMLLADILRRRGRDVVAKAHLEEAQALARDLENSGALLAVTMRLALLPGADSSTAVDLFEKHGPELSPDARTEAYFLMWKITKDPEHLAVAHRSLDATRRQVAADHRETMIENLPLYRAIRRAWREYGQ